MTIAELMQRAKLDYDEVFAAGQRSWGDVLDMVDVESTTYRTTVPNDVEPFAKVNKIGGMSYKSNNKIPFPYFYGGDGFVGELNGVTFTVLADGGISMVGTPTEEFSWEIFKADTYNDYDEPIITLLPLVTGNYYTLSGAQSGIVRLTSTVTYSDAPHGEGNPAQWCESYDELANLNYEFWQGYRVHTISLYLPESSIGTEINTVIYPMLNEGTTALPYEPYFEGLRSASVSELKSEFGNLFNFENIYDRFKGTGENEGKINIINQSFNTNIYTGQNGASQRVPQEDWDKLPWLTKGTYYCYFDMDFYEDDVSEEERYLVARSILNGADTWCGQDGNHVISGGTFTMLEDGYFYLRRYYNKRCIISNLMVTRQPRTEYIPYGSDILSVPEPIKSLDGYGLGVNAEYYNYIDFGRKVFVQNVYRKVFDGTEDWTRSNVGSQSGLENAYRVRVPLSLAPMFINNKTVSGIVCNHYQPTTAEQTYYGAIGVAYDATFAFVYDDAYNTADISIWKAHLAELYASGNPLVIDYVLAEPIETDISAYLTDEYIEVEGGGTITAVNEYGYDAPTNISYLIDTQGG